MRGRVEIRFGCHDPATTPLTAHNLFHTVEGMVALGTLALAVGTLVVASVTGWTAHRTRQLAQATVKLATSTETEVQAVVAQAEAARQEVEVSREALLATNRPRLVNVRLGFTERTTSGGGGVDRRTLIQVSDPTRASGELIIIVPVRNVGPGLALIQQVRLRWHEPGSAVAPEETVYYGVAVPTVLPPAERASVSFTFGAGETVRFESILTPKAFAVEVEYQDVSGQLAEMTRLDIVHIGEPRISRWQVRQVHFYEAGAHQPYASSGVAAERG